jgi:hypothetical protein
MTRLSCDVDVFGFCFHDTVILCMCVLFKTWTVLYVCMGFGCRVMFITKIVFLCLLSYTLNAYMRRNYLKTQNTKRAHFPVTWTQQIQRAELTQFSSILLQLNSCNKGRKTNFVLNPVRFHNLSLLQYLAETASPSSPFHICSTWQALLNGIVKYFADSKSIISIVHALSKMNYTIDLFYTT